MGKYGKLHFNFPQSSTSLAPSPACLIFAHPIVLHHTCERTCSSPDYQTISSLSEWLQVTTCAMMGLARQFSRGRYTFPTVVYTTVHLTIHAAIIAVVAVVRLIYVTQSALLPPSLVPSHPTSISETLSSFRAQSHSHSFIPVHSVTLSLFHSFTLSTSSSHSRQSTHCAIIRLSSHYTLITKQTKPSLFELISFTTATTSRKLLYSLCRKIRTQDNRPRAQHCYSDRSPDQAHNQDRQSKHSIKHQADLSLAQSSLRNHLHHTPTVASYSISYCANPLSQRARRQIHLKLHQSLRTTKAFARNKTNIQSKCASQSSSPSFSPPRRTQPPNT